MDKNSARVTSVQPGDILQNRLTPVSPASRSRSQGAWPTLQKLPGAPFPWLHCVPKVNHCPGFQQHELVLPGFELCINEIYNACFLFLFLFFCLWLLLLNTLFLKVSMWLQSRVCSFTLLATIPLWEYAMTYWSILIATSTVFKLFCFFVSLFYN